MEAGGSQDQGLGGGSQFFSKQWMRFLASNPKWAEKFCPLMSLLLRDRPVCVSADPSLPDVSSLGETGSPQAMMPQGDGQAGAQCS